MDQTEKPTEQKIPPPTQMTKLDKSLYIQYAYKLVITWFCTYLYRGLIITWFWYWFVSSVFDVKSITLFQAFGLELLITFFLYNIITLINKTYRKISYFESILISKPFDLKETLKESISVAKSYTLCFALGYLLHLTL